MEHVLSKTTKSKQKYNKKSAKPTGQKEPIVKFKKRKGTSGATGQLYESKLLSLVLLRCLTDNEVEDFLLGSNVDGVGDLDDICLRFTYKNKLVAAFIQSKHKDDASKGIADSSLYSPKSKVNLLKCFDSYLQVLNKFETDDSHIFNGVFKDLTFHFVIYTSAVNKISKEKIKQIDEKNNDTFVKVRQIIICKDQDPNSGDIFQIAYDKQDIDLLSNVLIDKEIDIIAKHFMAIIDKKGKKNYDIFKKYFNILVPDVMTLTENGDYYDASVNPKIFYAADEILIKLKYKIYEEILSKSQVDAQYLQTNLQLLLRTDNEFSRRTYLSRLIYRYILFDDRLHKLTFNAEVKENVKSEFSKQLEQLQVSKVLVNEALEEAGRESLNSESVQFKIPKQEIDINEIKECNDKKSMFDNEINIARDFMSTLYLYTNQGQEKDVGEKLISEISQYYQTSENSTYKSKTRADVASLKFHDKVQKWWLLDGKSYFLTKTCDYLEKLVFEIAQPFIDMLNFNYQHETDRYQVHFLPQAMNCLTRINDSKITNIITRSSLLTTLKLKQFLCSDCLFIDYKYLYNVRENEWELLKDELKYKTNTVLILVCDKLQECEKGVAIWLMANIVAAFEGKVVIVSNDTFSEIKNDNIEFNDTIVDINITLSDMATETQNKLLEHVVNFQGLQVKLKEVVDTDYSGINSEIVLRIIKNEIITVGHSLSTLDYENIKDCYVPRTFYDPIYCEFKLKTFEDMPRNINIIKADSGMGKSTILTHLSIETKKECPQKWILRMNLLDYSDEFQKLGPEVDRTEFMKLILKSQFEDISMFSIQDVGGNVFVEYTGNDDVVAFSAKVMMNCYSKRKMVFIFDGFDEICPDYQTQVTNYIKNIDYDHLMEGDKYNHHYHYNLSLNLTELFYPTQTNRFQIWITSRPYNSIIQHLEYEFGASLTLKPLTSNEQNNYYDRYWNFSFKTEEVNMAQFNNIQCFFDFMARFANRLNQYMDHFLATDIPLFQLYLSAVRYFKNQTLYMPLNIDKEKIINSWVSEKNLRMKLDISNYARGLQFQYKSAIKIVGVPLYMAMAANYFVAAIKSDSPKSQSGWDLGYTTLSYYKRFVELKLKVRFEDKNNMNISNPDVKTVFENEQAWFVNIHYKLAFYAMFRYTKYVKSLLTVQDLHDIELTMKKIKDGKEKSGFIESIHNREPRFIHHTFAEFFAVEFIVDIILTNPQLINTVMELILNFLLGQTSVGMMTMFDQKLKYDGSELRNILEQVAVKKVVFDLMWNQLNWVKFPFSVINYFDAGEIRSVDRALFVAIDNNLPNVTMFILRSIDGNLTKDNVEIFLKEFLGREFIIGAMLINHPEIVEYVLNKIREVDVVFIGNFISICDLQFENDKIENIKNEEILDVLREEIITPKLKIRPLGTLGLCSCVGQLDHSDRECCQPFVDDASCGPP